LRPYLFSVMRWGAWFVRNVAKLIRDHTAPVADSSKCFWNVVSGTKNMLGRRKREYKVPEYHGKGHLGELGVGERAHLGGLGVGERDQ